MFEFVCATDAIWDGELMTFDVGNKSIIVVNVDEKFRAFDSTCPHQDQQLSEGAFEEGILTCPAHLWQFDVLTGEGVNPTGCQLKCYELKIEDDQIYVDLSSWKGGE